MDRLSGYARFYALQQVFYTLFYAQRGEYLQFPVHVLLALWPSRALLVASHLSYAGLRLYRMPFLFNSDVWAATLDVSFAMALIATRRKSRSESLALGSDIVKRQLASFYLGAALWKVNSSFLSPRTSCSSILFIQLADRFVPKAPAALFSFLGLAAPVLTILVEFFIGVLLQVAVRWGVALGLLFHFAIALTPCPNCAGPFCVMLATRYFLLLAGEAETADRHALLEPLTLATAAACAAVLGKVCTPNGKNIYFVDASIPFYAFQSVVVARTWWITKTEEPKKFRPEKPWGRRLKTSLVVWGYFYSFGVVALGLGDMATTHMFSNLRVHGAMNHYFLPTGLLFRWFEGASPRRNPFAGGTVRVDYTNSTFVRSLYPQEWTTIFPSQVPHLRRSTPWLRPERALHGAGHRIQEARRRSEGGTPRLRDRLRSSHRRRRRSLVPLRVLASRPVYIFR